MAEISCRKTIQEIAANNTIHPIQVSHWKRTLIDSISEQFAGDKKSKDSSERQVKEAELCQQIGKLHGAGLAQKNFNFSDVHELRKLINNDHPKIGLMRKCVLLGVSRSTLYSCQFRCVNSHCEARPGSMLSTWRISGSTRRLIRSRPLTSPSSHFRKASFIQWRS